MLKENIPNEGIVCRVLKKPSMYKDNENIDWKSVFMFNRNCESVIWTKYAKTEEEIHKIGFRITENKIYSGYCSAIVLLIREINIQNYSFKVEHVPEEGIYHAHICYSKERREIKKAVRSILKEKLSEIFEKNISQYNPL